MSTETRRPPCSALSPFPPVSKRQTENIRCDRPRLHEGGHASTVCVDDVVVTLAWSDPLPRSPSGGAQ